MTTTPAQAGAQNPAYGSGTKDNFGVGQVQYAEAGPGLIELWPRA